jgi:hypothetical protein
MADGRPLTRDRQGSTVPFWRLIVRAVNPRESEGSPEIKLWEERDVAIPYVMKDLGYARTATDALYRVEMEDGSKWDVPVQVIADSRDEHYASDKEDTVGFIRSGQLAEYEIRDWAGNNMNWSDVKEYAELAPCRADWSLDFQEGWCNGEKEIVGTI